MCGERAKLVERACCPCDTFDYTAAQLQASLAQLHIVKQHRRTITPAPRNGVRTYLFLSEYTDLRTQARPEYSTATHSSPG